MLCVDEYSQYSASESGRNLAKGCSREYYSLMDQQESSVWFPEPDTEDATPAHRGEPTTDWLKRSTNDRARATRRFFNAQISALPSNSQQDIFEALHNRDRYHSAFFELVVSRTLQTLGAEIEIEPGGASDIRLDVLARFPDAIVQIEAVSPVFDGNLGETVKARNPLLDIVESLSPSGVWVKVDRLPSIGLQDSKKPFRRAVQRLLENNTRDVKSEPITVGTRLPQGELRLTLSRKGTNIPENTRAVGAEPFLTTFDNSEERIRRAVSRKRRQGRTSEHPAILAVHATGISSSYEEFDRALFGVRVSRVDGRGREIDSYFEPDGELNKGGGEPTWAAILAFVGARLFGGEDPVLYIHPRFRGKLPDSLFSLQTRWYAPEPGSVRIHPANRRALLPRVTLPLERLEVLNPSKKIDLHGYPEV